MHLRIHTSENLFPCGHCDNDVLTKCDHIRHMGTHAGEQSFICSLCDESFLTKSDILIHQKIHIAYNSHLCDIFFINESGLVCHMKIHVGEKLYQCAQCNKFFPNNCELKQHIQTHAVENTNSVEKTIDYMQYNTKGLKYSDPTKHINVPTYEKSYQCIHCEKSFFDKSILLSHQETSHGNEAHECSKCKRALEQISICNCTKKSLQCRKC